MAKIKAIFFDMDGVLVDARDLHYEALNAALTPFGIPISRDAHLTTFDGLSTRQKLVILSETLGLPTGLHDLIHTLKQQHTHAKISVHCRPVFRHRNMLARLRREGFRLALCSNSIRASVDEMTRCTGIAEFFEFMLSNEDVSKGKPAPDIYDEAVRRMGLQPEECLAIEDNANGIASAKSAGIDVLAVADPNDIYYDRVRQRLDERQNAKSRELSQ
jgi:HAD superfamily hydrolase (TIGR01509 family)